MCLAIPGKLIEISNDSDAIFKSGRVSFDGVIKDISLALVPEAKINDYVLVHVGTAIGIVDENAANETLELLRELEASRSKNTEK
jgi:hydrogenase expression/formation protein HypC